MTSVAVDVGGTFTDVCVLDDDSGEIRVAKVPSTSDPLEGVLARRRGGRHRPLRRAAVLARHDGRHQRADHSPLPARRDGHDADFRDVIEIRRGTRDDLWDAYKDVAPPYIRRRDRFEVTERVDFSGEVVEPLDEDERRARSRASSSGARSRPSPSASSTPSPTRPTSSAPPRSCARSSTASASPPPRRCCRRSSSTSASPPRWPTPCSRRSSAATCRGSPTSSRSAATRATSCCCTPAAA